MDDIIGDFERKIKELTQARDTYKTRLEQRNDQNKSLRASIERLKKQKGISTTVKLDAAQINNRRDLAVERTGHFLTGRKLSLPQESYQKFLMKCKDSAPEKYDAFVQSMEEDQHRGVFEELFSAEINTALEFNFKALRPMIAFQRGSYDIELAKTKGVTLDELKINLIESLEGRFEGFLKEEYIDPKRVNAICEIGAAWGAVTRYLQKRYDPDIFHVYEIDTAYAQWLADNLGVDSKNCDGETLSGTGDETMDIVVASSCLFYMPFVKQWNYLTEMARVMKPGGLAIFNVNIIERMSIHHLKGILSHYFPRRTFGYLPQHCLDTAFPEAEFEQLIENPAENFQYRIYRKKS